MDVYDCSGNVVRRYPVEIRSPLLSGALRNGDLVEVSTNLRNGELLTPYSIRNLTTSAYVRPKTSRRIARYAAVALFFLVSGFVAWNLVSNGFL